MTDRLLGLLGLARRAQMLSIGHDAAQEAIIKNKAKLCFVCSNGSQRLKEKFSHACSWGGKSIKYIELELLSDSLSKAIGSKAAVITVNDEGFAKKAVELIEQNDEHSRKD